MQTLSPFEQLEVYRRRADAAIYWGGLLTLFALALLLAGFNAYAAGLEAPPSPSPSSGGDPMLDALIAVARAFGGAVKAGSVFAAVVLGVVLLVLALRIWGKRLHDAIPDDATGFLGVIEAVLRFLFDTKPGGIFLNGLFSAAGSIGAIAATGTVLTPEVVGLATIGSGGVVGFATALYGWGKDLIEWWKSRRVAQAEAAGERASAAVTDTKKAVDELNKL